MTTYGITIVTLMALGAGCGKAKKAEGVKCDAKAVEALAASLDKANGINVELTDKVKADMAVASKELTGKAFAFDGCKFHSQGNDVVSFTAGDGDKSIDCAMKGGEAGVTTFRHATMAIGQDKVRLDVSGVIASHGDKSFARLGMTECEIAVHE